VGRAGGYRDTAPHAVRLVGGEETALTLELERAER
jgi:hypothetical protein